MFLGPMGTLASHLPMPMMAKAQGLMGRMERMAIQERVGQ